VLYVEFRKDQKPIDPEPWWADAPKKSAQRDGISQKNAGFFELSPAPPQFTRG
jgi:hypothetical protein